MPSYTPGVKVITVSELALAIQIGKLSRPDMGTIVFVRLCQVWNIFGSNRYAMSSSDPVSDE
jgi:hypothetical protein